ncbi:TatD family hydrolase [Candidatus Peregrinibacteria bacterium]|nr:MAG: TatD family hydrolase [Candidatus Peregrinibacteria bacterium]
MWIDTHCHPFSGALKAEETEAFERARAAGVSKFIVVGYDPAANLEVLRLIEVHPDAWGTVGIHPCEADLLTEEALALLREQAAHPRIVGLGEMGLDYYHKDTSPAVQFEAFRRQIRLANELDLPCIVHSRDAAEDTLRILLEEKAKRAIFHCYSYGPEFGRKVWEAGYMTSFSGVVTYPNAKEIQEAARLAPADLILTETDCPWLAPQSVRGQRNEMAYVVEVGQKLAELRGVTPQQFAEQVRRNGDRLF